MNVVRRESRALLAGTIARATRIGGYGESARPILVRTPRPSRAYLPALDGVRAIAILMVIVSHVIIVCHTANELPGMTTAQNFFVLAASSMVLLGSSSCISVMLTRWGPKRISITTVHPTLSVVSD